MGEDELQKMRDGCWDAGWNAALLVASSMLRSRLMRVDVTREEIAAELEEMQMPAQGVAGEKK